MTGRPVTIAKIQEAILDEMDRQAIAEPADLADVRGDATRFALRPNGIAIDVRKIAIAVFNHLSEG